MGIIILKNLLMFFNFLSVVPKKALYFFLESLLLNSFFGIF